MSSIVRINHQVKDSGKASLIELVSKAVAPFNSESFTPYDKGGNNWTLDSANNFFLHIREDYIELSYRYPSAESQAALQALATFLEWRWKFSTAGK